MKDYKFIFTDKYFVPVVTYLIFSVGDYTGRVLAGFFQWVRLFLRVSFELTEIVYAYYSQRVKNGS